MAQDEMLRVLINNISGASKLGAEADVKPFIDAVMRLRLEASADLSAEISRSQVSTLIGVDSVKLLIDAATFIGVGVLLQKILVEKLQAQNPHQKLNQVAAHAVIDIWGKLEAARALLMRLERTFLEEKDLSNQRNSLRAQCTVLLGAVKDILLDLNRSLGNVDSFARYALVHDWLLELTRSPEYQGLEIAIGEEIRSLAS